MDERCSIPQPMIRCRPLNQSLMSDLVDQGISSWFADLLARRLDQTVSAESIFSPRLSHLEDPIGIPDMLRASQRIVTAIMCGEKVVFTVDHDMDGTGSAAVLWSAFVDYFGVKPSLLNIITSHRLTEGYGITEPVADRIIALNATLVISADKGTSDEPRIKRIAAAGMDVIVTDHHAVPVSGPPPSAYAVVNPGRTDSDYDPYVCGAAVAFLTMAKVRTGLLEAGYKKEIPSLVGLMDYVAVATVADCVSLRPDTSYANRAFVRKGLELINQSKRPCWQVFNQQRGGRIGTEDIGFQLAPPIAAAGRLDWADAGVKFLLAKDTREAKIHWQVLQTENTLRKTIERDLRERAFVMASKIEQKSIVLYFDDGHSGVHGITASRLVESFGKPAAIFAPKGAGARKTNIPMKTLNTEEDRPLASGSFRGIPGFHVRDALQFVADHYPHLLVAFGGHEGAAGATIAVHNFESFADAYDEAVAVQLQDRVLHPVIWIDGDISADLLNFTTLDALLDIEPWGRDFPFPVFSSDFTPVSQRTLGDGSHLKLELSKEGCLFSAIWFNAVDPQESSALPLVIGETVRIVYKLQDNWYRGRRSLQLQVLATDLS